MRPLVAFVLCFFLLNALYLLFYLPDLRSTQQQQQQQPIVFTLPPLNRDLTIAHPLTSKPPPSTTKSPHDPHAQLSLVFLSTAKNILAQYRSAPHKSLDELTKLETQFAANITLAHALQASSLFEVEDALAGYLQLRFHAFQQVPAELCDTTPRLRCSLSKACGFACLVHHLADCFIVAHEAGRTLVVSDRNWLYDFPPDDPAPHTYNGGWSYFFQPLSTCIAGSVTPKKKLPQFEDARRFHYNYTILNLEMIDMRGNAQYAVYYVPETLKPIISLFHSRPALWYLAQVEKYLLRMNNETLAFVKAVRTKMMYHHPRVGFHIRRTDKLENEAKYHATQKYYDRAMKLLSQPPPGKRPRSGMLAERRKIDRQIGFDWNWHSSPSAKEASNAITVYAAADEFESCQELATIFGSNGTVMCNKDSAESASLEFRNSRLSLMYLLTDIFSLAESDVFVATFSSHVARLVHELMHDCTRLDSSPTNRSSSLDDKWYYSG